MAYIRRQKTTSELRQDLVSGDWVAVAPKRVARHRPPRRSPPAKPPPKSTCPFEDLQKSGHGAPILALDKKGKEISWQSGARPDWFLQVVPNKFPIVGKGDCSVVHRIGPYVWLEGAGFHEIVIYRDHAKHPSYFSQGEMETMLRGYQMRQRELNAEDCVEYVLIYHNHGPAAGATVFHPHSQIVAVPVIPPDVSRSIRGSRDFYRKHKRCVHCAMIAWELKAKKRIVYENKDVIVFCPFAPKVSYEVRIFPKSHQHSFEEIGDIELAYVADALRAALRKIAKGLAEPSYNFFLHTSPSDPEHFRYYHWHIEILPRTSIWAGVELGTGIEVSSVAPEVAAALLRKIRA